MNDIELEDDLMLLWKKLQNLRKGLRNYTKKKYNRVNPFNEDLFDWKEKGSFFGGLNVSIYDSSVISGDVSIGDNTWIGPFCSIDGTGGLKIGNYCAISTGVRILTHDSVKWALSGGKETYEYGPVNIGNFCFIGVESVILRNINIGNNCIIGANSIVKNNVPDFSIVAGSPAKVIGRVELNNDSVDLKYFNKY